jgi:putative ABC transport system permease protein
MPAPYDLPARSDLWLPVAGDAKFWQDDVNRQFIVIGRLKAGVDILQAQSEMDLIAQQVAKERPSTHAGWSTHLQSLTSQVTGQTRPVLLVLLAAVAFVLLIACANVASLLLCRSAARRKEMAIRAAMGAGRMRVIRQLLTESVLLALLGGGAGMLLSAGGLKILLALSPPNIPRLRETAIDGRVLIASLTLSFIAAVLFGLVPALHASKVSLSGALNAGGRGNSDGGSRRSLTGLVIAQVAVAFTLLVGAALLVQSFQRLLALDPGFAKTGVCAFDLTFRGKRYESDDAKIAFFRRVQEQFRALPGVHSLAAISHLPLGGSENVSYFLVEGLASTPQGHEPVGEERVVTPGYFQVMGVKLVDGRDFDTFDTRDKPLVAIVNQTLAQQFFPGGNAIGKRIRMRDYREHDWFTIVGIVRDVRATALELKPLPGFFLAYSQAADSFGDMTVVVRGTEGGLHLGIESGLRREMNAIDPAMPVANFRTMEELVSTAVSRPKFGSFLLSLFAATALTLTIIGLYGVVAYTVSQRLRELGIRLVLGATRGEILRMVLAQGMWPALAGLVLGLCAAMGLGRFLASLLFEIHATDPVTLVVASMILVGITALACWIPARRATRVDLMVALRHE